METITTRSLWCAVYAMTRGWELIGVEMRNGVALFRLDSGASHDLRQYHEKRAYVELHEANTAHTALTVALKKAQGLETWEPKGDWNDDSEAIGR
jgi:hypothetical protein